MRSPPGAPVRHLVARHRAVDHFRRRPAESIEQDVENRPAEPRIQRHPDAAQAQRGEHVTRAFHFAHAACGAVPLEHTAEEGLMDRVRRPVGIVAAAIVLQQQRANRDRLRHAHQRTNRVALDADAGLRQRIADGVDHDVAIEHRRAGDIEHDQLRLRHFRAKVLHQPPAATALSRRPPHPFVGDDQEQLVPDDRPTLETPTLFARTLTPGDTGSTRARRRARPRRQRRAAPARTRRRSR